MNALDRPLCPKGGFSCRSVEVDRPCCAGNRGGLPWWFAQLNVSPSVDRVPLNRQLWNDGSTTIRRHSLER